MMDREGKNSYSPFKFGGLLQNERGESITRLLIIYSLLKFYTEVLNFLANH